MTASVNHKCWIFRLHTRNDTEKRWKMRQKETQREITEDSGWATSHLKIKCQRGETFFHDKTDGFKTNINKRTAHAQMHCRHPHRDRTTTQRTINYVQYEQTSTNVGMGAIRSSNMLLCYMLTAPQHVIHTIFRRFSFGGHDRENKVIGVDLIHICYSRWSLQLLSSSVRLSLWTQTSKSIAYRVRSASLNSLALCFTRSLRLSLWISASPSAQMGF